MAILIVLMCVAVCIGIPWFISDAMGKNDDKMREEKEKIKRKMKENEKRYFEENNIPENANTLCCTNMIVKKIPIEGKWNLCLWKEDNILNFCGASEFDSIRKIEMPMENVKYFNRMGDSRVETITDGGGVSIGRAVIGGIIGAIIGAILMGTIGMFVGFGVGALLAGIKRVTTSTYEIDERKTYFYYIENGENKNMVFASKDYDTFLKLIPEKEMTYIENNKILESNIPQNDSIYKDIEKLSELKDKGILTEEEFNIKKQLLLDKIQ